MPRRTLHTWFEHSAATHPDRPALDLPHEGPVSYRALSRHAEEAAALITDRCGGLPARVGLLAEHTLGAYAGYLAILRLGAAVVPLSPANPPERNRLVCGLADVRTVLVDSAADPRGRSSFPAGDGITVVDLAERRPAPAPAAAAAAAAVPAPDPDAVAYILFTSGSTGRPKGVPIRHRHIVPALEHHIARCVIGPQSRLSHTYGLTFDPSLFDLFGAWGTGAALVVPGPGDLRRPVDYITGRALTHWDSVPSLVTVAKSLGTLPAGRATGLLHSVFGGEPVTADLLATWREAAPNTVLHNQYGPTELAVTCASHTLPEDPADWHTAPNGTVPIGTVPPHLEALVVDEDGHPADEGELCVRGPQRFDGYLDPADNAGRFLHVRDGLAFPVTDPATPLTPAHWYRTGDRVRSAGGLLAHLGRTDDQVKILGNRVELGDIEAALTALPGVDQAAVVTTGRGEDVRLVAFYSGTPAPPAELTRRLRARLPRYMLPQRLHHLSALPLNANGKIDRRRLAADPAPAESSTS